jgi:hypothetical protein
MGSKGNVAAAGIGGALVVLGGGLIIAGDIPQQLLGGIVVALGTILAAGNVGAAVSWCRGQQAALPPAQAVPALPPPQAAAPPAAPPPPLLPPPPPAPVPAAPITQTIGALRRAGTRDAHHVIQDAAVRDLVGYDTNAAPGVQLPGPSTAIGSPHYNATQVQRHAHPTAGLGGTYGAERAIAHRALVAAGFTQAQATQAVAEADAYFTSIGVGPNTVTRIPGNRH